MLKERIVALEKTEIGINIVFTFRQCCALITLRYVEAYKTYN